MDYFGGTIGSQEISARLCDTVVVTFYYCFALLKKDKLFFPPHFWQHSSACGILVPQLGIKPGPTAVKAPSPNQLTAREFPKNIVLY